MNDPVVTFTHHAMDFCERHQDLDEFGQSVGGSLIGMLRAILECDYCPGHFRVPIMQDENGDWVTEPPFGEMNTLYCPNCNRTWTRVAEMPEPSTPKRKKVRK